MVERGALEKLCLVSRPGVRIPLPPSLFRYFHMTYHFSTFCDWLWITPKGGYFC